MKENRLLFKEIPTSESSRENISSEKKSDKPLTKDETDKQEKRKEKIASIKAASDKQAELDQTEAAELLKKLENGEDMEKVENRFNSALSVLFVPKAMGEGAANYLIENMNLISAKNQIDLANALEMTDSMKIQNPKVYFSLVKAIANGIGKDQTDRLILSKISFEVTNIKPAGRSVKPELLMALADNSIKAYVSEDQWKLLWEKTERKDQQSLWDALALPSQEKTVAQR